MFGDGVASAEQARWARRLERYVAKMTRHAGGRPLLIRNPANSARIPALRAIWPDARFLHIHRHPASVYASSTRMFSTLVRELSLGRAAADVTGLVRQVYPRLMGRLIRDGASLPPGQFASIRYDDLCREPMAELERVHEELDLPRSAQGRLKMARYLDQLDHSPASHRLDADDADWLRRSCASIFAHFGYRQDKVGVPPQTPPKAPPLATVS